MTKGQLMGGCIVIPAVVSYILIGVGIGVGAGVAVIDDLIGSRSQVQKPEPQEEVWYDAPRVTPSSRSKPRETPSSRYRSNSSNVRPAIPLAITEPDHPEETFDEVFGIGKEVEEIFGAVVGIGTEVAEIEVGRPEVQACIQVHSERSWSPFDSCREERKWFDD